MPSAIDSPSQPKSRFLEVALIFLVFFVAGGAPVPHVNETHYLAKAKHYWQPDWLAGDLFLESGKAHLTFYWTIGTLTQWLPLPAVAWIGRIAAWLLLAFSWQHLSHCIIGQPWRSVLTAMLLVTLIDHTQFAGEWLVGGVEGKTFAYAFVFFGLAAMTKQSWHWVWLCCGAGAAFHALVGGWSVLLATGVWFSLSRDNRPPLLSMLPSLLLGGALALPGIVPALLLTQTATPETVEQANQIYVFERLPHHLAPLALQHPELIRKSMQFGVLLVVFAVLSPLCLKESQHQNNATSFARLNLLMRFAIGALLLSLAGLLWELLTWNHPALSARLLKYYLFRIADVAIPMATCLSVGWLAQVWLKQESKKAIVLLLCLTMLPALHLMTVSWDRYQNPTPPAVKAMKHPAAWLDACRWIRENTAQDSLFLVPRRAQSFKWYADRSDLVTWKDVPQSADALLVWHERFRDVHYHRNEAGESVRYSSLASQGTQRIRNLAAKYQLDYVLTQYYEPLDLPVAYTNQRYTVYITSP